MERPLCESELKSILFIKLAILIFQKSEGFQLLRR